MKLQETQNLTSTHAGICLSVSDDAVGSSDFQSIHLADIIHNYMNEVNGRWSQAAMQVQHMLDGTRSFHVRSRLFLLSVNLLHSVPSATMNSWTDQHTGGLFNMLETPTQHPCGQTNKKWLNSLEKIKRISTCLCFGGKGTCSCVIIAWKLASKRAENSQ